MNEKSPLHLTKNGRRIRNTLIASGAIVAVSVGGGKLKQIHDHNAKIESYPVCAVPLHGEVDSVSAAETLAHAEGHEATIFTSQGEPYNGSDRLIPAGSIVDIEHVNPNTCIAIGGKVLQSMQPREMK